MIFHATLIPDVWLIELEPARDERGWFARTFDEAEFEARGLSPRVVQCSASFNTRRDTLRGLHYQADPHGEPKLVRCVRGAIWDVVVDLRAGSPTCCRWYAVELDPESPQMLYVPPGVAHGFQTLSDETEVFYQMGYHYVPEAARGVRWDDPAFGIRWPSPAGERIVSPRDLAYPDFQR